MKKILIYSDCHFSQYSSIVRTRGKKYSTRLHNLIDSISWAEKLADENDCDEVINLGDFFDRSDLNSEELTALQDVYFCNKPHTFITGNHDANISNLEFSSIQIFKSMAAKIITSPEKVEVNDKVDLFFIPYLTGDKLRPINEYLSGNKKKIVFTHNDLAGIQYGKFMSQSGFNIENILENCTLFLNGHLHNSTVIQDKIVLVGNLTGQNFNENANLYGHYAYILTIEDDGAIILEPYVNPYAFNFYKLYINNTEDINQLYNLKDNAVLSISCNSRLINNVSNIIKNSNKVVEYRLVNVYNKNINSTEEQIEFKTDDHLQQFIDYVQTKIQPSEILTDELARLGSL